MYIHNMGDGGPVGTNADLQIASLIPIIRKVINTLGSLGLAGTRALDAEARGAKVITTHAIGEKFRAADELAAILKTGNSRARALAASIVDVLQLKLPFGNGGDNKGA
jgi:hypothetical protein